MLLDNNESISGFIGSGMRVPEPPRAGEIIICQMCGQPMLPENFSKNQFERKREFKWHIHAGCFKKMEEMADRGVPGLLAERKKAQEHYENR